MSESSLTILCITAISIAFIHTLIGPDHYLPFIVMSKARNWSLKKTLSLTFACGLGHVLSSVVLGLIGVAIGIGLSKLEAFESMRGSFAAQAMMIFGFSYCVWGLFRALKNRSHTLLLPDEKGEAHDAHSEHKKGSLTAWALFIIFVLGPCEPLIPILMYPAAEHSLFGTILVATLFSVVTILTMMSVVLVSIWGVRFIKISKLERFSHALAGGTILLSGMAIQLLGL
jgi:nickel/cobalt transporter (NicO) family protein